VRKNQGHFLKSTLRLPEGQSLGRVGADAHKVRKNQGHFLKKSAQKSRALFKKKCAKIEYYE